MRSTKDSFPPRPADKTITRGKRNIWFQPHNNRIVITTELGNFRSHVQEFFPR